MAAPSRIAQRQRERHTQKLVHPSGAGYGCATIVTTLTLEPGQSIVQTLQILSTGRGVTSAIASVVDLLPGDYNVYAEVDGAVDGRPFSLRSNALQFSVQEQPGVVWVNTFRFFPLVEHAEF